MADEKDRVWKMKLYYQEFHHKCVTWYITVMGLFLAGTIAARKPADESAAIIFGWSIIIVTVILTTLFFACIFHFSARISKLNNYLESQAEISENWYTDSKNVWIKVHGFGSLFFFAVMVAMQLAVIWLASLTYFY